VIGMSFDATRMLLAAWGLAGSLAVPACARSSPASSDLLVEPIPISSVDVIVEEGEPPRVSAHVRGALADGCSSLYSIGQERSDNTVVVTILRQRPANAICIQVARIYAETVRLEGAFPPGRYVLRVNAFETSFTVE
jgi:hypothetical protein